MLLSPCFYIKFEQEEWRIIFWFFGHILTHSYEENEKHGGIRLHKTLEIKKKSHHDWIKKSQPSYKLVDF
jgi:hypothetical protein